MPADPSPATPEDLPPPRRGAGHPSHVAVLDDESDIRQLLKNYLQAHGLRVTTLASGHALMALLESDPPDLVLLDLGLPGEDGMAIARQLAAQRTCGIVIVTGRSHPIDRVLGLEFGADDYITKPFELRELMARIRAVLRRTGTSADATTDRVAAGPRSICFGGWTMNMDARSLVDPAGRHCDLTSGEFDLLHVLARNAGRVMSREVLIDRTRGLGAVLTARTIDVQISRLRTKLQGPYQPQLVAIRNVGYKLVARDGEDGGSRAQGMTFQPGEPSSGINNLTVES